jgi:hypothetical protein
MATFSNYEFHADSTGERFVITRDDETGQIVAACGPLHHSEILDAIENGFDSDPELVEDLRKIDEAE